MKMIHMRTSGLIHALDENGVTLCGKHLASSRNKILPGAASMGTVTCPQCMEEMALEWAENNLPEANEIFREKQRQRYIEAEMGLLDNPPAAPSATKASAVIIGELRCSCGRPATRRDQNGEMACPRCILARAWGGRVAI